MQRDPPEVFVNFERPEVQINFERQLHGKPSRAAGGAAGAASAASYRLDPLWAAGGTAGRRRRNSHLIRRR